MGFLAAAAAVAVPILIHLLMRPRARPASIGSLRFLKLAMKETKRRRKIRHWLLLALRAAAVALLALLFARPYFTATGGPGRDREVALLIDRSASMSAKSSGKTLLALAQEAATDILKDLPEGTAAHVAYFDGKGVTPCDDDGVDLEQKPGYAGTNFGAGMCWARDVLLNSNREQRKLYILTDMQRSGLKGTACKGFPADVEVEVIELGNPLMGNLAVEKIDVPEPTLRGNAPVTVTAHISNAGAVAADSVPVQLRLKSNSAAETTYSQEVTIKPGAITPVQFSVPITQADFYGGCVEIEANDALPWDDRRWLVFEARNADRILLVDGEPGVTVFRHETYFLQIALRLSLPGRAASRTPYDPQYLAYNENAGLPDLVGYQTVALCNVARLSDVDAAQLHRFVSAGGRLLVFTGGQVLPEGYATLSRSGLLGAQVIGENDATGFRLQDWKQDHPILRPFADPQRGDLRALAFRKITRLKPDADAKTLATTQSGDPLLIEKQVGRGAVLVFASTVDCGWSSWPQSRLFVPVIHQMIGYLNQRLPENGRIRAELAGPGPDKPPGILSDDRCVVVRNVDPGESHTERCSQEEFCEAFALTPPDDHDEESDVVEASVLPGSQRPGELWTYLVWGLLGVLAFELLVANRTHA
jgi:hypothetical protein